MYSGVHEVKRSLSELTQNDLCQLLKDGRKDLASRQLGDAEWRRSDYLVKLIEAEVKDRGHAC